MTVEENIAFGLKLKKMEPAAIREKVAGAIKMVELNGKESSTRPAFGRAAAESGACQEHCHGT